MTDLLVDTTSFPSWTLYGYGLNGTPAMPPMGLVANLNGMDWLCLASQRHGEGGSAAPPEVAVGSAFPTDLAHGFVRGQFEATFTLQGSEAEVGLAVLCNHASMQPESGGKGYGFSFNNFFGMNRLSLVQFNNGLDIAPYTALGSSTTLLGDDTRGLVSAGPLMQLRVRWEVDMVELRGIHLTGWVGRDNVFLQSLEACWYGPTTYLPSPPVLECLYYCGTVNESAALFRSATLAGT